MMRRTQESYRRILNGGTTVILLILLPLLATAFVGQRHPSGFFHNQNRHLSSFQKSDAVTLPTSNQDDESFPSTPPTTLLSQNEESTSSIRMLLAVAMAPILLISFLPLDAMAAATSGGGASAIPSALWSYGHLVALLGMMGTVVAQKLLVQFSMTQDDEGSVGMLNIAYSLALTLLLASGYFRVAEFGKGASFYSHEITFWIKMAFTGVQGGLALFKTITLVKRGMASSSSATSSAAAFEPMSDQLVARMQQILNAEITGLVSIPLVAALMARGVWYWDDFPWQAGAALTVLTTGGASFFYAKQALTWKDN